MGVEPQARVTGDLTIGGSLNRGAQSTIVGTVVEHATVPTLRFPSTEGLLGQLKVNFGTTLKPDIFVGPGGTFNLPAGGQRVNSVTLHQGAKLIVSLDSALEVMGSVNLGPQARVTVRGGGRLIMYVHQTVETSTDTVIEQSGQALGRGLIVALGSGATMHWGTNAQFGPGLVYGVEPPGSTKKTTLADIVRATGALVTSEAYTSPTSQINLNARYLACADSVAPLAVTLSHPADRSERTVPQGTTAVAVQGTVNNVAVLDSLAIQDGTSTRTLSAAADGTFSTTAKLRSDGEPTNICVVASDCQGRVRRECVLVGIRHDLELLFTSPMPGDRVSVPTINITGRVMGGVATRVSANGIQGGVLGNAFTIPRVPLANGGNVLTVEAQASSGDVVRRRLLVFYGPSLNVWNGTLEFDADRKATLVRRTATEASRFPLVNSGAVRYRLLDVNGSVLHESGIPGTNDGNSEVIRDDGTIISVRTRPSRYHVEFKVPELTAARTIQFIDEQGIELGRQGL
jgi:hypothetical protein